MERLRLCYVGPSKNVTLRRWVEWFAVRGHHTTVITVEPSDTDVSILFRQIDVNISFPPRKIGRLISTMWMVLMLRRLNCDVVHAHYVRGLAWGLLMSRISPFVATPWGSDILEEQGAFNEWYSRAFTRRLLEKADMVTVHSAYMERRVQDLSKSNKTLARIGWGVDLALFKPGLDVQGVRQQWHIPKGWKVIFSPRLAQPLYRHELVIHALRCVCDKVPNVLLVIPEQFADRTYVAGLRRLASELRLQDHVRFVASIPYQDMPLWFNLADIVVMVPRSDGMPNSLLEAMACGAVPVLNQLPQYDEVIEDQVNGFLVEPEHGDLPGVLIEALCDTTLRKDIVQRNRALVMEIADQNREMSRMEQAYHDLASSSASRSRE